MRILAAIDIHARPEGFLRVLKPWAERLDCRVDLAYASPYRTGRFPLREASEALLKQVVHWRDLQRQEREELWRLQRCLAAGVRGEPQLLEGAPHEVVPRAAERYGLVVLGTRGRTGWMRAMLGSVSEGVARRAETPVLVLRLDAVPVRLAARPVVVLPVGWPPDAGHALDALHRLLGTRMELHLVHVVPRMPWELPDEDPADLLPGDAPGRARMIRRELGALAAAHGYPGAHVHPVEAEGDPIGADIIHLCERVVADLVVLPTRRRSGLARLSLGSVPEWVLRHAEVPVLIARSPRPHASPPELPGAPR